MDVLTTFPASKRARDLWIDVRVTHALQRGKLRQIYKFCREVFKVEYVVSDDRSLSSYLHKPTPAVISSVNEKTVTYKGMFKNGSDQRDAALHNHVPQVMSYVISHEGESSEPIETLTTHWKNYIQSHAEYFQTGEQLGKKTVMFCGDLKETDVCDSERIWYIPC